MKRISARRVRIDGQEGDAVEPLKPRDVRRASFGKPPTGRRGYDENEVDEFLDHVEHTLSLLYHELAVLRDEPTTPGGIGARSGGQLALPAGPSGTNGAVVHFSGTGSDEPSAAEKAILAELDQIKIRLARIESAVQARF
jgi:DivIVA domain-containing protein